MTAPLRQSLCALTAFVVASAAARGQLPPPSPLAITNVTIVDVVAGRTLPGQNVLIADGRIVAVGPSATTPAGAAAVRVDGQGKFLIPGLIDTHVHFTTTDIKARLATLAVLLSHGVTGVRDAGWNGQDDWLLAQRQRAATGEVLSPRLYVSGIISGRALARTKLDAAGYAQQLVDRGVDGLKIRDGLTADDIRAIVAVGARANRPVFGHTYDAALRERDEIYTLDAINAGVIGTMHIMGSPQLGSRQRPTPPPGRRYVDDWQAWWVYYATLWRHTDPAAERALIETMVARRAWLEPTLITEDWIVNAAKYRAAWSSRKLPGAFADQRAGFPALEGGALQEYREAFTRMQDFVRRFHAAGGTITAGTDCLPVCGYGLQDELRLLVDAGLTPAAALRAATVDAARVLGWNERVGRVAPGLAADLVLLDGDPLRDIEQARRVHAVFTNGRHLDRQALDRLLAGARGTDPISARRPPAWSLVTPAVGH